MKHFGVRGFHRGFSDCVYPLLEKLNVFRTHHFSNEAYEIRIFLKTQLKKVWRRVRQIGQVWTFS